MTSTHQPINFSKGLSKIVFVADWGSDFNVVDVVPDLREHLAHLRRKDFKPEAGFLNTKVATL